MKFNFRKVASVLASVVMLGSTIGIAAAANYPTPFVAGGVGNVAIVYGDSAAFSDGLAAGELSSSLQFELGKQTATGGITPTVGVGTCAGECAPLYTGSSKIYINDTLNSVKSVVTKADMPTLLADGSFSGNVDATYTQTIVLGSNPQITFAKQPTSSDDPQLGLTTSTTSANYIYNASVTFNKAVNFTSADSKSQDITLFGQKFMVGSATDTSNLVLLKSASKLNFDSSGTTSQEVTIGGNTYTVEMVSASTSAATIRVTNAAGVSEQKEINEGYSKKVNGITIAVDTADSNNLKYTASVVAGAEKMTFTSGSAVTEGDAGTVIDGTLVTFTGTTGTMTGLTVSNYAPDSDHDAILPGSSFVDPVFGTLKLNFAGLNVPENSTARETIAVKNSGDDKLTVGMTDMNGVEKTIQYVYNGTTGQGAALAPDADGHIIRVSEMAAANRSDYIVVGNEDEGRLIKVTQITNQTDGYSQDKVQFQDVFSGDTYDATLTADGAGTVTIGGKVYTVSYFGNNALASEAKTVRLNYPDSSGSSTMIVYPTIQTSKGAKVMFYKPLTINVTNWDGVSTLWLTNLTTIKIPNGARSYESISVKQFDGLGNMTVNDIDVNTTNAAGKNYTTEVAITNTNLNFTFSNAGNNMLKIQLTDPQTGVAIPDPALVIIEPKDDNNQYHALVVETEPGQDSTDGIGVSEVARTWDNDNKWQDITLASDSTKTKEADLWGTITTVDSGNSDQVTASISIPSEQVYAQLYMAQADTSVTGTSASGGGNVADLGDVIVKDSEISLVSTKNLVVVGGSCINTVARKIIDPTATAAICGADFTTKTQIGANQALVKVVTSPYAADKVAMLVAGYEAADTTKAVKWVTTTKPDTTAGKSTTLSTSSTVATTATTATA